MCSKTILPLRPGNAAPDAETPTASTASIAATRIGPRSIVESVALSPVIRHNPHMSSRRKLVTLTAVLLIAGGATGGALAARSHGVKPAPVPHLAGKNLLAAASIYLGIPVAQLRHELHPGHTLRAIASSTPRHP